MDHALETARMGRHPQRRTPDTHLVAYFARTARARITFGDFPFRIIRRCAHNANVMPLLLQSLRHLGGVFARSRQLGRVVEPVDKDSHRASTSAGQARPVEKDFCETSLTGARPRNRASVTIRASLGFRINRPWQRATVSR